MTLATTRFIRLASVSMQTFIIHDARHGRRYYRHYLQSLPQRSLKHPKLGMEIYQLIATLVLCFFYLRSAGLRLESDVQRVQGE
ncbi:hypothetical protein BDW67DRAFT_161103 [Aspergillus spinulosporus]